jgi:hypothetical protein
MSKIFEEADVLNVLDTFMELYTELYGDRATGEIIARLPAGVRQEVAAEVRQEGEAQGLRESIRGVLEARFGAPEADVLHALDALDVDGLKKLLPVCATGSLADVRERLGLG